MIKPSTFSIVAYDAFTQSWGVAVASKFPAVGAVVPWAKAGAGAIATQAFANTSFGPIGLTHLANGQSAKQTFKLLRESDPDFESRQIGIVDKNGDSFSFTGKKCYDFAGGISKPGYAIQGNILAGEVVINAIESAYIRSSGPLVDRLVAALKAGDDAGGDKRGKQSAAVYVVKENGGYASFNDRMVDYRVDDDPDPIRKLLDLVELYHLYFDESMDDEKLPITSIIADQLQQVLAKVSLITTNSYSKDFLPALREFIGNENFEDRVDFDKMTIDKPVFEYLIRRFNK